jgi:hypothetical protein
MQNIKMELTVPAHHPFSLLLTATRKFQLYFAITLCGWTSSSLFHVAITHFISDNPTLSKGEKYGLCREKNPILLCSLFLVIFSCLYGWEETI